MRKCIKSKSSSKGILMGLFKTKKEHVKSETPWTLPDDYEWAQSYQINVSYHPEFRPSFSYHWSVALPRDFSNPKGWAETEEFAFAKALKAAYLFDIEYKERVAFGNNGIKTFDIVKGSINE